MRVQDAWAARAGPGVPSNLDRADVPDVDDDHLLVGALAVDPDPDRPAEQPVRDGVLPGLEGDHRRGDRDSPGNPERDDVRRLGQRVQPGPFLRQHLHWCPSGDAVDAGVDQRAERLASGLEVSETLVGRQQVDLGRDQVRLGQLDRGLAAALGRRVRRLTGVDHEAVVPGERDGLRVADRHPGDVLDRDGLLVVGQHVGRGPAEAPQRDIERSKHAGCGPVPQRQDDPES